MAKIRTFVDSNVLIAAACGREHLAGRAFAILNDPERDFVTSDFVRLETLPKAKFHKQDAEAQFYKESLEMMLKLFTIKDIRGWDPCYDPNKYLPEGWSGTALDILRMYNVPARDRVWCVLHKECLDARTLRLFAVRCARAALAAAGGDPDPRSLAACDAAERFANGRATLEELADAGSAADAAYAADAVRATYAADAADAAFYAAYARAAYAAREAVAQQQVGWLIDLLQGEHDGKYD